MTNATASRAVASSSSADTGSIHASSILPEAVPAAQASLEIFRERALARALLVANGRMPLIDAVDQLQATAERTGLVDRTGQDAVQKIMADVFGEILR